MRKGNKNKKEKEKWNEEKETKKGKREKEKGQSKWFISCPCFFVFPDNFIRKFMSNDQLKTIPLQKYWANEKSAWQILKSNNFNLWKFERVFSYEIHGNNPFIFYFFFKGKGDQT